MAEFAVGLEGKVGVFRSFRLIGMFNLGMYCFVCR